MQTAQIIKTTKGTLVKTKTLAVRLAKGTRIQDVLVKTMPVSFEKTEGTPGYKTQATELWIRTNTGVVTVDYIPEHGQNKNEYDQSECPLLFGTNWQKNKLETLRRRLAFSLPFLNNPA